LRTLPSSADCMSVDVHLSGNHKNEPVLSANSILVEPMLDTNEVGNLARANSGTDHPIVSVNGTQPLCSANGGEKPLAENWSVKGFASPAKQKSTAGDQGVPQALSRGMQVNGLVFEARECKSANGTNASQERWLRAVEKFRTYEADLTHRAERSKKTANTARPLTKWNRPRSPEPCVLARGGFDELWDGLIPDQHNGVNVSIPAASLAPLPRSVSLMVVETRQASRDRPGPGDRHASKKVLEKLYESLRRMLPSL
jgi:hypothetical protein